MDGSARPIEFEVKVERTQTPGFFLLPKAAIEPEPRRLVQRRLNDRAAWNCCRSVESSFQSLTAVSLVGLLSALAAT
jgi:hypothetical protein